MADNISFFKKNVDFYSSEYRDYELKAWERKIVECATGNVLDVACGGGRVTVPMLRRGHNVTGTDFVAEFEQKIRQHEKEFTGVFQFKTASMGELPFEDASFDTVTCINSIIYAHDREQYRKIINELSRVLKPSGRLYVTTWNVLHPLWGISLTVNYILHGCRKFGETSPFFKTDRRTKNGKVKMYVPTKRAVNGMLGEAGICGKAWYSDNFLLRDGKLSRFKPIIVITGVKI